MGFPRLLMSLCACLTGLALCACPARNGSGRLEVLYQAPEGREWRGCYPYPGGGFLLCREDRVQHGSISRLDEAGKEIWHCGLTATAELQVLHIDDAGSIYVTSGEHGLEVISAEGGKLWSALHLLPTPEPDWLGAAAEPKFMICADELQCRDASGKLLWTQEHKGHSRHLAVDRQADGSVRLYYSGTEQRPDAADGNVEIVHLLLDGDGNILDSGSRFQSEGRWSFSYTGRFRLPGDGRVFMLRDNMVFELLPGEGMQVFIQLSDNEEYKRMFLEGDMYLTPEGNYLFATNNCSLQTSSLDLLEYSPQGELLHAHILHTWDIGSEAGVALDGLAYYDMYSRLCYFYVEASLHAMRGSIRVTDLTGKVLAEYPAGKLPITRFFREDSGTIVAQRLDGTLLRIPRPEPAEVND
ncbi:MAG: hypothetical protein R3F46_08370 [bacterium]